METVKNSILVVDDEAVNIRALIEILSEDYTVYVEKSGLNCYNAALRLMPDLILLDVMMPEIDGFGVIKSLKEDETTKSIPVIFVTGLVSPDDETKGFNLGAVDYIKKPFSDKVVKMRVYHQMEIINQRRKLLLLREAEEIERKRQEQERLNRRTQQILNSAPIGIEIYDENLNLVDISFGTLKMYGVDDKEKFIKHYTENPLDYAPEFQANGERSSDIFEKNFEKSKNVDYVQFAWLHRIPQGEAFPTEVTLTQIKTDNSTEYVAYVHDLREIRRLEAERLAALEEASRAKSRFLARMSHEIRTPITAVLGISEVLLRGQKVPTELEEAMTKIYDSSKMLLELVNDILDFSKIESGNMPILSNEYDVASLINDSAGIHFVLLEQTNVTFTLNVDENIPERLIGDVLRIRQILTNLLSNAFKFTESGSIVMSVEREDIDSENMMLTVTIKDTGAGMTPKQVEAIQDDYVRFHEEEIAYATGTGLGIPIVYNLAQMMNASIEYESEVGMGTAVTVHIPQKISGSEVLGTELARSLEKFEVNLISGNAELEFVPEQMPYGKILVVDDVDTNLYVAEAMLGTFGLTVELCESGIEAIEKVKNGNIYDIIFMDQMMPEMDGIEATTRLREMGYVHPIVALTANAIKGEYNDFLKSGLSGFMTKPIDIKVLNSYLVKFVKNKER
ncbi:MAG: response regulator [Oscillospiraceae bacterium]|nr:response regulator [Oscillospiraceae bacterium]